MQQTSWQAVYLRRREWVRSALRGIAVVVGLWGLLGLDSMAAVTLGASLGGRAWANVLAAAGSPLTWLSIAVALGWFSTRLSRWIVPLPSPGCPRCGYSLKDLRSPICPECGLDLRPPSGA